MRTAHIQGRRFSLLLSVWPDTGKAGYITCRIYSFGSCLKIIVYLNSTVNDDPFSFHSCNCRADAGSHNDQVTGQLFSIIQDNLMNVLIFSHNGVRSLSSQIEPGSCFFKAFLIFKSRRLIKLYGQDLICHLYNGYFLSSLHQTIGCIQANQTGTDDHNVLSIFCQFINSLGVS